MAAEVDGHALAAMEDLDGRGSQTAIDLLVDGGKTPGGLSSTVLDATREPPVVLRAGAFRWSESKV